MNMKLLYPRNEKEYKESGLKGKFDINICGECMLICELQITMKDFLLIKVCFLYIFFKLKINLLNLSQIKNSFYINDETEIITFVLRYNSH